MVWLAAILVASAGASVFCPSARGAEEDRPTTIRVGAYENPPKVYANREGIVVGIFPDILDTIAHEQGWRLEYVFGTWEECLRRLESNAIDVMVDIAFSEERAEKYLFSDKTIFVNWATVYTRNGFSAESLLDLKGKKVATVRSDIHTIGKNGIRQLDKDFNLGLT